MITAIRSFFRLIRPALKRKPVCNHKYVTIGHSRTVGGWRVKTQACLWCGQGREVATKHRRW